MATSIRPCFSLLKKSMRSSCTFFHSKIDNQEALNRPALYMEFVRRYSIPSAPKEKKQIKLPLNLYGGCGNYASALFLAAEKSNQLSNVEKEILTVVEVANKSQIFAQFMADLSVPVASRVKALTEFCCEAKFAEISKNFLVLLAEKGRLKNLDGIAKKFKQLTMAHRGEVKAVVTTVIPLPAEEEEELKQALKDIVGEGKTILLEQKVDGGILGGIVVEFDDKIIDMSIKARLRQMERLLREPVTLL